MWNVEMSSQLLFMTGFTESLCDGTAEDHSSFKESDSQPAL